MHNTQSQWITALLMALLVLPLTAIIHAQGQGPAPNLDNDRDGIPDRLETQLLARFTPYFRFSLDGGEEQYRPMDALNYVRWSELQNVGDEGKGVLIANSALSQNPNMLLSQGSSLLCDSHTDTKTCSASMQFRKDRFLNPLADVPRQGGNWARHGWAWADVLARRNVGLYGHVVHFRATPPQTDFLQCSRSKTASDTDRDWVLCDIDLDPRNPRSYYKVEYWQFFGYNGVGKPFDLGDHEGDWTSVQVIVDAATLKPVQVHHFAHGYRFGFDLQNRPERAVSSIDLAGGKVREYRGQHWNQPVQFWWHDTIVAKAINANSARLSQNNVLRMMRDSQSGEYSHPVVYVEHGGHEFWPSEGWSFQDAPNHNGDDTKNSYLAAAPPNLGEVESPLSETAAALVVLRYNGRWGAYARRNDPPQGPVLHNGWTWPESSALRWRLPKDLGN